jgi:hypothetical protein
MQKMLQDSTGLLDFKHDNGELSHVRIEIAGMEMKTTRTANLKPEVPNRAIRDVLIKYGEVKYIKEEQWTRACRY